MGGYGSGRQGWRPVIEQGLKLDLRSLRRQGLFNARGGSQSVTLTWTRPATGEQTASVQMSYSTELGGNWLRLLYCVTCHDGERVNVDETFQLESFPQPFGGVRWYILCPERGVRCQCLCKPHGAMRFRSRQGFSTALRYYSQGQDAHSRTFDTCRRIAAKVLRAGPPDWRKKHRDWEFPPKPPWMRWMTYNRHLERWEHFEAMGKAYLVQLVGKLRARGTGRV